MMLVDFWATWCGSCIVEFADLQNTLRMYGARDYSLVTVAANMPDEKAGVLRFLQKAARYQPELFVRFAGYCGVANGV